MRIKYVKSKFWGFKFVWLLMALVVLLTMFSGITLVSASTSSRDKVSLNGIWDFYPNNGNTRYDINVPSYWDSSKANGYPSDWDSLNYGVYKKSFTIPSSMSGKEIFIELRSLTVLGKVFINGTRVGGETSGNYLMMCLPYQIDITPYAIVGGSNNLEVDVYGKQGIPSDVVNQYPFGTDSVAPTVGRRGINGDVNLIAYPKVNISDVQINTDLNKNTDPSDDKISFKVTITNNSPINQTVTLKNSAALVGGSVEKTFTDQNVTINSNSSQTVLISNVSWNNAKYWWPYDPKLYTMTTSLVQGASTIDSLDSQFGFRQFYRKDNANYFELNGTRFNLRGDSIDALNRIDHMYTDYLWNEDVSGAADTYYKQMVDEAYALNLNVLRNHSQSEISDGFFNYCDQKGMTVIDEAPFWIWMGSGFDYSNPNALNNVADWVNRWAKERKNHASIIMYSMTNEPWNSNDQNYLIPKIQQTILNYDSTRPVYDDGINKAETGTAEQNYHYPAGSFTSLFNTNNIYTYASNSNPTDVPKGVGEEYCTYAGLAQLNADGTVKNTGNQSAFDGNTDSVSEAVWAREIARAVRGARYIGFADYRPFFAFQYCFDPIEAYITPTWSDPAAPGLKFKQLYRPVFNPYDSNYPASIHGDAYNYYQNSFSPVAVFDKAFDTAPKVGVNPDVYVSGNQLTRTLLVYNDELNNGTSIDVAWEAGYVDPDTNVYTKITDSTFNTVANYGTNTSNSISFTIPSGISGSKWLTLKLTGSKNSVQKFTETSKLGVINSIPAPKLSISNSTISIGTVTQQNVGMEHKIKLVNLGGGLSENWTASAQASWLKLNNTSGNLRGEQEVYFTVDPTGLTQGNVYTTTVSFTGNSGSTATATVSMTVGADFANSNLALNSR